MQKQALTQFAVFPKDRNLQTVPVLKHEYSGPPGTGLPNLNHLTFFANFSTLVTFFFKPDPMLWQMLLAA